MEMVNTIKKEQKTTKKSAYVTLRVGKATGKQVQQILDQINKKEFGRRVSADAVIARAISRINESDISEIQESSLSHKDRFARDYARYVSEHGKVSRDEYLGLVMNGKLQSNGEVKK